MHGTLYTVAHMHISAAMFMGRKWQTEDATKYKMADRNNYSFRPCSVASVTQALAAAERGLVDAGYHVRRIRFMLSRTPIG